jgi:serine/threonine-protein kinase
MERKTFLGKYRVTADEIALANAEPESVAVTAAAPEELAPAAAYRGEEIESGRAVTVEVMPAAGFKPAVREKLEAEAEAAKKINHINIPALVDFGVENDQLIYVTEYFDGTSAEEWVNQHGPMPTGAVLRIALQVIGAMGAASFHKIAHHAINPANLILVPGQTPEGDWPLVKVLHFIGVAPTFTGGDISVAAFDKSSHYASPEQLQGKPVDFRSEIYSLGATMWFLLTGAPPLMAPKGPLALQPTTIGLAVDKLQGMPKRVRRLVSQMLSADPAARPQDPLAFYRQIQDAIAHLDRRESMARKLGVPFLSRPNVVALPKHRRFSAKTLALAAIVVAFLTVGSVLLANYFRHQRIRQAEEPIGVPVGVPDASAPAPQVAASTPPVIASAPSVAPAPPQPLPQNTAPLVPAQENQSVAKNETSPAVATNNHPQQQPSVAPAPSEPPKVVAQNPPPAETVAPAPAEPPKVAANEPKVVEEKPRAVESKEPVETEDREEKNERAPTVATARPISPEVRRAEPAPPEEGPDHEEAPAPAPEKTVAPAQKVKKDRAKKPKRELTVESVRRAEPADDEEEVFPSQAPQAQQLPRGRTRAKFIGVTADGNWMFSLPNKKIVIVPPPPGG